MIWKGSVILTVLNRPPIMSASLTKCEIKCFLRVLDIPYLPQQFNENWINNTDPKHELSCIFLLFLLCSFLGQLRTLLKSFIWFSLFFFQAIHYEPIKGCLVINSWSLLEVSQWHHLNCHLIYFSEENPSISLKHTEYSDSGKILNHSWTKWHFFSSRLSDLLL